jgi:hypothetical protein
MPTITTLYFRAIVNNVAFGDEIRRPGGVESDYPSR